MKGLALGSSVVYMGQYKISGNELRPGEVLINRNKCDQAMTPLCFSYPKLEKKQREIGLEAEKQCKRNIEQTFKYIPRLIGLTKEDHEQIEIEKRFFDPGFADEAEDEQLCVTVNKNCLKIEHVMAGFIEKLIKHC